MSDTTTLGLPLVAEVRAPRRRGEAYFIRTFGCQMNEHDSERIAGLLESDEQLRLTDATHAVDRYLDHLRVERGLTENTLEAYARDVRIVLRAAGLADDDLHAEDALRRVSPERLLRWLRSEREAGRAGSTLARRLAEEEIEKELKKLDGVVEEMGGCVQGLENNNAAQARRRRPPTGLDRRHRRSPA